MVNDKRQSAKTSEMINSSEQWTVVNQNKIKTFHLNW